MTATVHTLRPPQGDNRRRSVTLFPDEWQIIRQAMAVSSALGDGASREFLVWLDARIGHQLAHPSSLAPEVDK